MVALVPVKELYSISKLQMWHGGRVCRGQWRATLGTKKNSQF
jgi:hypothetical protein